MYMDAYYFSIFLNIFMFFIIVLLLYCMYDKLMFVNNFMIKIIIYTFIIMLLFEMLSISMCNYKLSIVIIMFFISAIFSMLLYIFIENRINAAPIIAVVSMNILWFGIYKHGVKAVLHWIN